MITSQKIKNLQQKIFTFYKKQGRHDLPWRHTTDPYYIFVSEIMLQQTQVDRVINKYNAWLQEFPTLQSLANAPLSKVLKLWSGLGYNSRAKRLQDAAKILVTKKQFPKTPEELIMLPGIGPYTARSILIFAFNQNVATVDTNIRRIFIHEFHLDEKITDKELFILAQKILPQNKSRDWHNALMDYGATYLTAKKTKIKPKTTQSKFKDSKRFYRGQIIKLLTQKEKMTLKEIEEHFIQKNHDIKEIILSLQKDALIVKEKNNITLAK